MAGIDKSTKLMFNDFQRSIAEVPLDVYYQTINSDQYNANGFQFNIKQPGTNALLDTEYLYIRYPIVITEGANDAIAKAFETPALNVLDTASAVKANLPSSSSKICFRGGNIMWRAIQNLNLQINNRTINVQPYKYIEELNRIYISNEQSDHEFSGSGGAFDSGNHGTRTSCDKVYAQRGIAIATQNDADNTANMFRGNYYAAQYAQAVIGDATHPITDARSKMVVQVSTGYYSPAVHAATAAIAARDDPWLDLRPLFPDKYPFYNPGLDQRLDKFIQKLRLNRQEFIGGAGNDCNVISANTGINGDTLSANPFTLAVQPMQFNGNQAIDNHGAVTRLFKFYIYERLPISVFKMYSNDEVFGVLPNLKQMQIQANFLTNLHYVLLRSNQANHPARLTWDDGFTSNSSCHLYLRWYTPPQSMAIPRSITVPYKKITTWSKTLSNIASPAANATGGNNFYSDFTVQEYNITLEAIPDLLLIYVKWSPISNDYLFTNNDSGHAEILDLYINIDATSGKLNQIQEYDLYQKWKKLMKHADSKIIGYDEWRRYCSIACLLPEDYGCMRGPGYSNQTVLGINLSARMWGANESIMWAGPEALGGNGIGGTIAPELIVTCIYNRNSLTINDNGTCTEELLRIGADFNVPSPAFAQAPM